MIGRKFAITALVLGVALVAVALVIKCIVVPDMKKWPDDVDATRYYEGTLHDMLDPEALTSMDLQNLFMEDVPVKITRHYSTVETEGNKAVVREVIIMTGDTVGTLQSIERYYAIDRESLEAIPDFSDEYDIPQRQGLIFDFPIGVDRKDYVRWVNDFQKTAPVRYLREKEIYDEDTYVFESILSPGEIVNPAVLSRLPQSLPKDVFSMLVSIAALPEEKRATLQEIVPTLPDPVPLKYLYEYEAKYWVEPETGMNINVQRHEKRTAAIEYEGQMIPVVPVFDVDYHTTTESINVAIDDSDEIKDRIDFWERDVSGAMTGIGAILIIFGLFRVFLVKPRLEM